MIDLEAMSGESWSDAELDFVRANYKRMHWDDMAIALRRTASAVIRKAYATRIIGPALFPYEKRRERKACRLALLRQFWEAGHSVQEISAMYPGVRGWTSDTIKEGLRDMGFLARRHKRSPALKAAIARLYGTMSATQIGIKLGCSRNVVIGTARDMGLCKPLEAEHERRKGKGTARGSSQRDGVAATCVWRHPQAGGLHSDGGNR